MKIIEEANTNVGLKTEEICVGKYMYGNLLKILNLNTFEKI